jgi:hypothetical protein
MKKRTFLPFITVLLLTIFSCISPQSIVEANPSLLSAGFVQASGQFCDLNVCGSFNFNFNPYGGPVSGSFKGTRDTDQYGILHLTGSLAGSFAGGDGGQINGSINNTKWWWTSRSSGNVIDSPANLTNQDLENWSGNLFSTGNGSGTIGQGGSWNVTFSKDAITPGSNASATEEIGPTSTEKSAILATPTEFAVVGSKINMFPQVKAFINASPTLDDITKGILNQDSAIVARDQNNQFYGIDNQGKSIPLPPELNSVFMMTNQFAILGDDNLLASSEHSSIRGSINGGGDFVLLDKIPPELKAHDYSMIATNCSDPTTCNPVMIINSTASSTKVSGTCLYHPGSNSSQTGMNQGGLEYISSPGGRIESSEHCSIRGSINGGGDFIYQPQTVVMASNILPSVYAQSDSSAPGYLGVLVENKSGGAEIMQIQAGSPAENAGLQIGDLIANVSGTALDDQHTLGSTLAQYKGGDEVILGIIRNGKASAINLNLATMGPPVIITPSAGIQITGNTELVVDIGFNGVTGVLVLADRAVVAEKVTGTQVTVNAGQAVIVVPGEAIGAPFAVDDSQVNKWWENPAPATTMSPTEAPQTDNSTAQTFKTYKDFNPFPNADEESLYIILCIGLGVIYLIVFLVILNKK